ncbi:MAG: DUF6356 family protein [Woeseiaceae bacterium]|nr:DUF6356 family protein [Woeseiaceae bacterium]
MSLAQKFTEHPESVGETYGEHFVVAMRFSLSLFKAAFVCAVHAVFPWLFEKTGSRCITELHERMVSHRASSPDDSAEIPARQT